jgi:ribosomal protein S18 acetylase RimI-like enzyme
VLVLKQQDETFMNNITIRRVTAEDADLLQAIGWQTFLETFAASNTKENMNQYLEQKFSKESLAAELTNPNTEFYFAETNGSTIGYLKLNFGPSQTELKDDKALEIERIYVLKEYQGKKAGQLLYEKAMQIAIQKEADYVWLGVWEANERAISIYKKWGFVEFDKHLFQLGNDALTDIMMKLQLKA